MAEKKGKQEGQKNPNTNCLEGRRCPKCGSYGPFTVLTRQWVSIHDDGTDDPPKGYGDIEYEEDAAARCQGWPAGDRDEPVQFAEECDFEGKWGDFLEKGDQVP
jgi:hypothetical protein